MKTLIINQPLIEKEPAGIKAFIVPLNIAESRLRAMLTYYTSRIEVLDLDETFDLGYRAEFKRGKLVAWKGIPVF